LKRDLAEKEILEREHATKSDLLAKLDAEQAEKDLLN